MVLVFIPTILDSNALQYYEHLVSTDPASAVAALWGRVQGEQESVDLYTRAMHTIFSQLNVVCPVSK